MKSLKDLDVFVVLFMFFGLIRLFNILQVPIFVFYNKWPFSFEVFGTNVDTLVLAFLGFLVVVGFLKDHSKDRIRNSLASIPIGLLGLILIYEIVAIPQWVAAAWKPPNVYELRSYYWLWAEAQIFGLFSSAMPAFYLALVGLLGLSLTRFGRRALGLIVGIVGIVNPKEEQRSGTNRLRSRKLWMTLAIFGLLCSVGISQLPYMNPDSARVALLSVDGDYYVRHTMNLANTTYWKAYFADEFLLVYPVLCYGISVVSGIDVVTVLRFMVAVLIWLTGLGYFWIMKRLRLNSVPALYGMMLGIFAPSTSVGMFTGQYEAWMAYVVMMFMLGFLVKCETKRDMVGLFGLLVVSLAVHVWVGLVALMIVVGYAALERKVKIIGISVGLVLVGIIGMIGLGLGGIERQIVNLIEMVMNVGQTVTVGFDVWKRVSDVSLVWVQGRYGDWCLVGTGCVLAVVVGRLFLRSGDEKYDRLMKLCFVMMIVGLAVVLAGSRVLAYRGAFTPAIAAAIAAAALTATVSREGQTSAQALTRFSLLLVAVVVLMVEVNATLRLVMLASQGLGFGG